MRSSEVLPSAALRPFVRLYWLFELDEPDAFGPPERICPDGLLEVVFHCREPMVCRYDGEAFAPQPRCVAVSQTRRFLELRPAATSGLISVRFQPWGACHFFAVPLSELADRQTPAEVLWGRSARELEDRLAEASSDEARVALLDRFLLSRLSHHRKTDVEPLVRAVWRHRGQLPVPALSRELGVGERRLRQTFADAIGTTPKAFARLARFLSACRLIRGGDCESLTDVGLACGYYDQSHFIAEFKAFSGMTPGQFSGARQLSFLELD